MTVTEKPAVRKELFVVIAIFIVPPIVLRGSTTIELSFTRAVIEFLSSAFQIFIVLAVARKTDGTPPRAFGVSRLRLRDAVAGVASVAVLAVAAVVYRSLASGAPGVITVATNAPGIAVVLAVVIAIAAAYREEFLYRAYIVRRFDALGFPTGAAIVFGAMVFGAAHLSQGIAAAVYATILGAALGAVFVVTGSLHGLAAAHAAYNISVILSLIPGV